jgi:hypothetical protein
MISLDVVDTDAFLDMPQSSQLLYFHLNARADDDGFVANPKRVMRNIGSQGDDLKVLAAKKFVINFDDGVCVIKHWRINNFIRKDIYKETKYLNLKQTLFIRPNGAYTQTNDNRAMAMPHGHFQLNDVDDTLTERQLSIGKVSKVENRIDKNNIELPIWLNKNAWNAWIQHRKEKKKSLTPTSMKLQIKFLEANKEDHAQIIKNSITNGWTGLFPIKKDTFQQKKPPRYIEPSTSKEDNDRRNELLKQSEELSKKFNVK